LRIADKPNRGVSMSEPLNPINNTLVSIFYQTSSNRGAERTGLTITRDISQTPSKYVVENKKIFFEKYDRYGNLISRVPWSAGKINEKA
jgi:hypothetical protein